MKQFKANWAQDSLVQNSWAPDSRAPGPTFPRTVTLIDKQKIFFWWDMIQPRKSDFDFWFEVGRIWGWSDVNLMRTSKAKCSLGVRCAVASPALNTNIWIFHAMEQIVGGGGRETAGRKIFVLFSSCCCPNSPLVAQFSSCCPNSRLVAKISHCSCVFVWLSIFYLRKIRQNVI